MERNGDQERTGKRARESAGKGECLRAPTESAHRKERRSAGEPTAKGRRGEAEGPDATEGDEGLLGQPGSWQISATPDADLCTLTAVKGMRGGVGIVGVVRRV